MDQAVFYGILIPFLGTSLGAACVFFMKHDMERNGCPGFLPGLLRG